MKHILYLAHDLADPAIRRRVLMLKKGGATVTVAGFQRAENLLCDDLEVRSIVLGKTADARFMQRIGAVTAAAFSMKQKLEGISKPDVVVARNVEMLAPAARASRLFGGDLPVVYECLDIHRLLLDEGMKGKLLRGVEGYFGAKAQLLITSSPAFIENYFRPRSNLNLPTLLVENKVLDLSDHRAVPPQLRPPKSGKPWRIGWFGAIRCRKSLSILADFAHRMDGRVEIVLRGRPAYSEFPDFDRRVQALPFVEFHGAYRNPEDLASIYADVQFVWAIDFFEEGLNSNWLLPNRLYEGSVHGAIPIALKSTETGRFLDARGVGVTLDEARPGVLAGLFEAMTPQRYGELFASLASIDRSHWVTGPEDCRALVARLTTLEPKSATGSVPVAASVVEAGRL